VHQALGWALEHDPDAALRLAIALAPWWLLRGRWATGYQLLAGAAGHAGEDRPEWCTAQLSVSVGTVRSRLDRIRAKTGSRRRADLTRLALQADLVLVLVSKLQPGRARRRVMRVIMAQ
jgi:hypothetical protein